MLLLYFFHFFIINIAKKHEWILLFIETHIVLSVICAEGVWQTGWKNYRHWIQSTGKSGLLDLVISYGITVFNTGICFFIYADSAKTCATFPSKLPPKLHLSEFFQHQISHAVQLQALLLQHLRWHGEWINEVRKRCTTANIDNSVPGIGKIVRSPAYYIHDDASSDNYICIFYWWRWYHQQEDRT